MASIDTSNYARDRKGNALCSLFFFFKGKNGSGFSVTCLCVPETLFSGFLSFREEERLLGGGTSVFP